MIVTKKTFGGLYETLGEVRHQEGVPKNLPKEEKRRRRGPPSKDEAGAKLKELREKSAFEVFWGLQRDLHWTEIPYIMRFNRKKRAMEGFALVADILIHLAPSSAFNPMQVWALEQGREKAAEDQKAQLAAAAAALDEKAAKGKKSKVRGNPGLPGNPGDGHRPLNIQAHQLRRRRPWRSSARRSRSCWTTRARSRRRS